MCTGINNQAEQEPKINIQTKSKETKMKLEEILGKYGVPDPKIVGKLPKA